MATGSNTDTLAIGTAQQESGVLVRVTAESGIGVDLVVREPLAMFGTHPALTGRAGEVVLGKKSGKASITYTLEKLGIAEPEDAAIGEMLKQVKDLGIKKRGLVTDDEFRVIATNVIGAAAKA